MQNLLNTSALKQNEKETKNSSFLEKRIPLNRKRLHRFEIGFHGIVLLDFRKNLQGKSQKLNFLYKNKAWISKVRESELFKDSLQKHCIQSGQLFSFDRIVF